MSQGHLGLNFLNERIPILEPLSIVLRNVRSLTIQFSGQMIILEYGIGVPKDQFATERARRVFWENGLRPIF